MITPFLMRFDGPRSKDRAKSVMTYAHCRGHQFGFKLQEDPEEVVQVKVLFSSEADRVRFINDQNLKGFYGKHSRPEGAQVVVRSRSR